jgi:hypothetical protein
MYIAIFAFPLFIISIITAYYGPKKWLIISAITSFMSGLFMGMLKGINLEGLLMGLFFGLLFMVLIVSSGIWVRYGWRERDRRILKKYWGKITELIKNWNKKD